MTKKIKEMLDSLEHETNESNIPLLDGLYLYFDDEKHDSGFNYIWVVGEKKDKKDKYKTVYKKVIGCCDVINLRKIGFEEFYAKDLNMDYCDGEVHIWSFSHRIKMEMSCSNFIFSLVEGSAFDGK